MAIGNVGLLMNPRGFLMASGIGNTTVGRLVAFASAGYLLWIITVAVSRAVREEAML